jgi:hypothetical protein
VGQCKLRVSNFVSKYLQINLVDRRMIIMLLIAALASIISSATSISSASSTSGRWPCPFSGGKTSFIALQIAPSVRPATLTLQAAYANFAGRIRRVRYWANFARRRERWGEAMREHETILDRSAAAPAMSSAISCSATWATSEPRLSSI